MPGPFCPLGGSRGRGFGFDSVFGSGFSSGLLPCSSASSASRCSYFRLRLSLAKAARAPNFPVDRISAHNKRVCFAGGCGLLSSSAFSSSFRTSLWRTSSLHLAKISYYS